MANAVQVQILQDGPRNTVAMFTGELDTITSGETVEAYNVKLAPLTYAATYNLGPYGKPATWRIDFVEFSITNQLDVTLYWDATTPQIIFPLAARGNKHFKNFGGISGYLASTSPGWTGGIGLSAQLSSTVPTLTVGAPLTYMIVLDLVKQGPGLS